MDWLLQDVGALHDAGMDNTNPVNGETQKEEAPVQEKPEVVSTHVLVPRSDVRRLRLAAMVTRIHQSEYLREAVTDLLAKYSGPPMLVVPVELDAEDDAEETTLESVVFRLTKDTLNALKDLAKRTRVRQSEYLREAVRDLLLKHRAVIDAQLERRKKSLGRWMES